MWFGLGASFLLAIISYLLGSFPTGYLLGRLLKGIDIREQGSGSTGATNVLRILGKGPGVAVLLVDVLKGLLALALVNWIYSSPPLLGELGFSGKIVPPEDWRAWLMIACASAAILGHSKSLWLNFMGGKSVATSLGILLMLDWRMALAALGVFGLTLAASRWVSLSSILATISVPIWLLILGKPLPYLLFGVLGGVYVVWRHRSNIQRLLAGTEPKLGKLVAEMEMDEQPSENLAEPKQR
jgi:acyl phosphate:glycerol-3-phosphate acyltransferase